jgi:hypothetical protein
LLSKNSQDEIFCETEGTTKLDMPPGGGLVMSQRLLDTFAFPKKDYSDTRDQA